MTIGQETSSDVVIAVCTEVGNTVAATAGIILTAFGVIGTGGALVPLLLLSSSILTLMKMIHIKGLNDRKENIRQDAMRKIKESEDSLEKARQTAAMEKKRTLYTALQEKEVGTALALGATTIGAGVLTTSCAASSAAAMGVLHPALSLVALSFAINALVEFYDNVRQWQERVGPTYYYTEDEKRPGALKDKQVAAARNLAISSFVKLLGWSCVVTGGFALAAPFAPWLIPGGLALIAGSHLYNNFFAAVPRVSRSGDYNIDASKPRGWLESFVYRPLGNSCREKVICVDFSNVGLQLL